jgi:hypothetical protein
MKNLKEIKLMMERLESPRMTDTEYQKRRDTIKEEEEGGQGAQDSMNQGAAKKLEKVTDKEVFQQFNKYLEGRNVAQQVEVVIGLLKELPLEDEFYKRFKRTIMSM